MISKNCKGCRSDISTCDSDGVNKNGSCPCTNCLVKAICSVFCLKAYKFVLTVRERGLYK